MAGRRYLTVPAEIVIRNQEIIRPWCMDRQISFSVAFNDVGAPLVAQFTFGPEDYEPLVTLIKSLKESS